MHGKSAASDHFSCKGTQRETGFWNWTMRRKRRRRRKRMNTFWTVQRNCSWTFATSCWGGRKTWTWTGMRKTPMRTRTLHWSGWTQSSQNGCCGHGGLASPDLRG